LEYRLQPGPRIVGRRIELRSSAYETEIRASGPHTELDRF